MRTVHPQGAHNLAVLVFGIFADQHPYLNAVQISRRIIGNDSGLFISVFFADIDKLILETHQLPVEFGIVFAALALYILVHQQAHKVIAAGLQLTPQHKLCFNGLRLIFSGQHYLYAALGCFCAGSFFMLAGSRVVRYQALAETGQERSVSGNGAYVFVQAGVNRPRTLRLIERSIVREVGCQAGRMGNAAGILCINHCVCNRFPQCFGLVWKRLMQFFGIIAQIHQVKVPVIP